MQLYVYSSALLYTLIHMQLQTVEALFCPARLAVLALAEGAIPGVLLINAQTQAILEQALRCQVAALIGEHCEWQALLDGHPPHHAWSHP
jgi:hypothetical protein